MKELRGLDLLASSEAPVPRPIQWDDILQLHYLTATIKACFMSCLDSLSGQEHAPLRLNLNTYKEIYLSCTRALHEQGADSVITGQLIELH